MADSNPNPIPIETKDLLDRFSNHLYARSGMADGTIALVVGYIRRMIPVIGAHPSQEELDRYVTEMRRRKTSYANLTNALKSIEHYMAFLGDPIKFQRPRKPRSAGMTVLSEGKIALIINAAKNLREKTMLMVLAYSGCRNFELINIRICDVDIAQQGITIRSGKGDRGRVCPLAGECSEVLVEYMRERKGLPDDFIFVTVRHGHKLQTQDVRKLIRVMAKRAGVSGRVWPHLFRHSLATAMLTRGASVYSIQAILGHAYVSTTMDYCLHPNSRNVRSDYHRYAPSFV
jgi:integrase/recombinase XerD